MGMMMTTTAVAAVTRPLVITSVAAAATNVFFITVELFVDPTITFQHTKNILALISSAFYHRALVSFDAEGVMSQQQSFLQAQQSGDSLSKPILGLFELIDRILDKGLVIDAYVSITVIGIPLVVIRARIVVASVDTFLRYQDAMGLRGEPGEKVQQQQQQPPPMQQQQQPEQQGYYEQPQAPMQQQGYISP
jgi:gas vesicle structural protein